MGDIETKLMAVQLSGIRWDDDGEGLDLPETLTVRVRMSFAEAGDPEIVNELGVEAATDLVGFCIQGVESIASMPIDESPPPAPG